MLLVLLMLLELLVLERWEGASTRRRLGGLGEERGEMGHLRGA
jgi:hypothetical protein